MKAFRSKCSLISEISPLLSFYNAAHPRCFGSFARNPAKFPEPLYRRTRTPELLKSSLTIAYLKARVEELTRETFKWEDYIRWQQKLNEAKASTAALKGGISGLNCERKPPESKWKAFFRRSRLEDVEPVSKNNIYDKGFLRNLHEIIFPLSSRHSFSQAKSKSG